MVRYPNQSSLTFEHITGWFMAVYVTSIKYYITSHKDSIIFTATYSEYFMPISNILIFCKGMCARRSGTKVLSFHQNFKYLSITLGVTSCRHCFEWNVFHYIGLQTTVAYMYTHTINWLVSNEIYKLMQTHDFPISYKFVFRLHMYSV